jgi:hypothetical protein
VSHRRNVCTKPWQDGDIVVEERTIDTALRLEVNELRNDTTEHRGLTHEPHSIAYEYNCTAGVVSVTGTIGDQEQGLRASAIPGMVDLLQRPARALSIPSGTALTVRLPTGALSTDTKT